MRISLFGVVVLALVPASVFAVDGEVLINQATVLAQGGFPLHITQPGSYKLSGDLNVTGFSGISIESGSVTLDLNGFTVSGASVAGIVTRGAQVNITVRNGTVTNTFTGPAIDLQGSGLLADIEASATYGGISVDGFVVVRCVSRGNFAPGFTATNSTISDSIARGNVTGGFAVTDSVVSHSTASGNGGSGFYPSNSNLAGNVANRNTGYGIEASSATLSGSNTLLNNTKGSVTGPVTSQNNNLCSSGPC
jgi:hypothetical protein